MVAIDCICKHRRRTDGRYFGVFRSVISGGLRNVGGKYSVPQMYPGDAGSSQEPICDDREGTKSGAVWRISYGFNSLPRKNFRDPFLPCFS